MNIWKKNEEILAGEKMMIDLISHYFLMSQLLGSLIYVVNEGINWNLQTDVHIIAVWTFHYSKSV